MRISSSLLTLAIAAALAIPFSAGAVNPNAPGIQRAMGLLDSLPGRANRNAGDDFVAKDLIVDADGTEHARFERTSHGMPVLFGDFVVSSRNGQLKQVSQTLRSSARPGLDSKIKGD